jgi:hypothetical protein
MDPPIKEQRPGYDPGVNNQVADPLRDFFNRPPQDGYEFSKNSMGFNNMEARPRFDSQMMRPGVPQDPYMANPGQNTFNGRTFVNSGDLLVQQFLLENIQKRKGRIQKRVNIS